ncbi:MAG: hypothetical protein J6Y07_01935 [Alphaproteobacteria bacterium]|nr:hypothetical protein [Alphaproteobacteria bacterium]
MQTKKWTREFISEGVHKALKECDLTKTTKLTDDDIILAIDSFDWYKLWMFLEKEFGEQLTFDPKDGLTTIPNCTPNIIIDFLYDKLSAQEKVKQVAQRKSFLQNWFHNLFSKEKD